MVWRGSSCSADLLLGLPTTAFNPWALPPSKQQLVAERLTERLPSGSEALQWAMPLCVGEAGSLGVARDRGNLGVARQDLRPDWLTKPAYLDFTSLRAYPLRQLHRLCAALRQRTLPLAHPAVHALVRQLLYHVGPVTSPKGSSAAPAADAAPAISSSCGTARLPSLVWREGWDDDHDVLPTLCAELDAYAEQLEHAPRDQGAILLLGEVAAYLSDWYEPCRTVVRRFAGMASRMADEMDARVAAAQAKGKHRVVGQLRAQQVVLRGMALGCYGAGPLCLSDVGHMVQLVVLVRHGSLFQEEEGVRRKLRRVGVAAQGVMAGRAEEVTEAVRSCPQLLTAGVSRVLPQTAKEGELDWQQLQQLGGHGNEHASELTDGEDGATPRIPLCSFEAVGPGSDLYSVNLLEGAVLLNGRPPSRLPKEVTEHPLFVRTFGEGTNFEVARDARGVLSTLRPVEGRFYEFFFTAACTGGSGSDGRSLVAEAGRQRLVVYEVEPPKAQQGELRLQLLDALEEGQKGSDGGSSGGGGARCGLWGRELPVRLRELHSHWLSREDGVLLLRPPHFQSHNTHFVIVYDKEASERDGGGGALPYTCLRVPTHLRRRHWTQLLSAHRAELTDGLVLPGPSCHLTANILGKFEDPQFVHVYSTLARHRGDDSPSAADGCGTFSSTVEEVAAVSSGGGSSDSGSGSSSGGGGGGVSLVLELPRYGLEFEVVDGQVVSRNYTGYRLRQPHQQLVGDAQQQQQQAGDRVLYTLPGFRQYLVLERVQGAGPAGAQAAAAPPDDVMVLAPAGEVDVRPGATGSGGNSSSSGSSSSGGWGFGSVWIRLPVESGAQLQAHCYRIHSRFGHLVAPTTLSRLQLAALYAATSTLLPEPHTHRTGAEAALQLLRQCWGNVPLTPDELIQLRSVGRLGGHLVPQLLLLIHEREDTAWKLRALDAAAPGGPGNQQTKPQGSQLKEAPQVDNDAVTAYQQGFAVRYGGVNRAWYEAGAGVAGGWGFASLLDQPCWAGPGPRLRLTPGEEVRVLGTSTGGAGSSSWVRAARAGPSPGSGDNRYVRGRGGAAGAATTEPVPVSAVYVGEAEAELASLVVVGPVGQGAAAAAGGWGAGVSAAPAYPLLAERAGSGGNGAGGGRTPLEAEMHAELASSWAQHQAVVRTEGRAVAPGARKRIRDLQRTTRRHREAMESYLVRQLSYVSDSAGCAGAAFRLLRAAGVVPTAGLLDLLGLAVGYRPHLLKLEDLNPFLSPEVRGQLHKSVLLWLQLCVLEDRLGRLAELAAAGPEHKDSLIKELLVRRTWDVAQHPQWLAFEAEGRLQIRPAQYALARHLLENPGAVVQLNMGEGKTRVILPMLALHWADGAQLVRLHFLSPLLDEAHAHLHVTLCASVLGRKLLRLPFHRDVQLTPRGAQELRACLEHCKQEGGLLLVAPEHRLSMELKLHELLLSTRGGSASTSGSLAAASVGGTGASSSAARAGAHLDARMAVAEVLQDVLYRVPYTDLLDESDEVLHHRYQLIYAVGSPAQLPALNERVTVIQALLRAFNRLALAARPQASPSSPSTPSAGESAKAGAAEATANLPGSSGNSSSSGHQLLCADIAVFSPPAASGGGGGATQPAGGWCGLRLLPGAALESGLPQLLRCLVWELLARPPHRLAWLQAHPRREELAAHALDASRAVEDLDPQLLQQLQPDKLDSWLALRGQLGCGLLAHALAKRHLVDYGVDRRPTARKRLAVPYRAAHTPSERSEFAQPDVALLLTHLSYYYDGLSYDEFRTALDTLLRMGGSAQRAHYEEWLDVAAGTIPDGDLAQFRSVRQVDPTNPQQLSLMHTHMRHNMAVADFWLKYCVLPSETKQFPQRLAASAWHLARNTRGRVVGFSGTNDNHRLLPLLVHQEPLPDPHLAATNGLMLARILDNPRCHTLEHRADEPAWQCLLQQAVQLGADALLDCGALMAGTSNRSAAEHLVTLLRHNGCHKGVCYHDTANRSWMVLDLTGRRLHLSASPVSARECFVLYDEARCRGADLQLRRDAVGLLTLGPGLCKDKLMQAAGRMRLLGRGQTVQFVGTPDVWAKVGLAAAASAADGAGAVGRQGQGDKHGNSASGVRKGRARGAPREVRGRGGSGGSSSGSGGSGGSRGGSGGGPMQLTSRDVLQWVMCNTVRATQEGLLPWAGQGLHYAASRDALGRAVQDELLTLDDMYGSDKVLRPVSQVVGERAAAMRNEVAAAAGVLGDGKAGRAVGRRRGRQPRQKALPGKAVARQLNAEGLMSCIADRAAEYGEGHLVATSRVGGGGAVDEECERELQEEDEQEQEVERQVPRAQPVLETDWAYGSVLGATCVSNLDPDAGVARLCDVVRQQLLPASLGALPWSPHVYCTRNFAVAVSLADAAAAAAPAAHAKGDGTVGGSGGGASSPPLSEYLRPVDTVLVLVCGSRQAGNGGAGGRANGSADTAAGGTGSHIELLLLSEREADGVLQAIRLQRGAAATAAAGAGAAMAGAGATGATPGSSSAPRVLRGRQDSAPPEEDAGADVVETGGGAGGAGGAVLLSLCYAHEAAVSLLGAQGSRAGVGPELAEAVEDSDESDDADMRQLGAAPLRLAYSCTVVGDHASPVGATRAWEQRRSAPGVWVLTASRQHEAAAALVSAMLFNGETTYSDCWGGDAGITGGGSGSGSSGGDGNGAAARGTGVAAVPGLLGEALRRLVSQRVEEVEALVDMRGKGTALSRSELEEACSVVAVQPVRNDPGVGQEQKGAGADRVG